MRYGITSATAAIVMAFVAAAPLTGGAADSKAQTTTQETKTMVSDTWITSKTKISLFSDERVKGTQVREEVKGHGAIQVREVWKDVSRRWELLRGAHEGGQVIG
jgi:osmotically-inducible protein OsmY